MKGGGREHKVRGEQEIDLLIILLCSKREEDRTSSAR